MKKNNKKGFTLAELLIVVAIIAVLTAIAIPIFTSQLERSREATDISNIRSYYAEITSALLVGDLKKTDDPAIQVGNNYSATLTKPIPAAYTAGGDNTFTVTVKGENLKFQQQQAGWQTANFEIAGVRGGKNEPEATNKVGAWASDSNTIVYTYTLAEDGDYVLTQIALSNT